MRSSIRNMRPFQSVGLSNETEIVSIFKVTIDAVDLYDSKTGNSYENTPMVMQSSCRVTPLKDGRVMLRKPRLCKSLM